MPPLNGGDEVFFWTREWQAGEQESAAERAAGNLRRFRSRASVDEFLDWLESEDFGEDPDRIRADA